MAAELKESFDVETELLSGERGDFEVLVNEEKVFSKKKLARFPEPGEITQLIRQ
ncbi:MAG: SelT/SelW/SelH family protein [Deltaproteobacteria bacterium]|nr:SelT/SelW/SelH family protein [Deltaproteobacteria bacterium]